MGEEEITTTTTTTPTTITLNRNNKKKQHGDSSISLDSSRRTPTDRRFAPPPNSILAGYSVTIVPCTIPRAAPLEVGPRRPAREDRGLLPQPSEGHGAPDDQMAPSQSPTLLITRPTAGSDRKGGRPRA